MDREADSYRTPARLLHWVVALIVLLMIPAGFLMVQPDLDRGTQNALFVFHKNVGVLVLLLVLLRLAYRMVYPPPPLPTAVPGWQARIAGISHFSLYVLLFVMPLAGYIRVKAGGFPIEALDAMGVPSLVPRSDALAETAKAVHFYGAFAITGVVGLHIGAAAYHGLFRRDGVFSRIWPPLKRGAG